MLFKLTWVLASGWSVRLMDALFFLSFPALRIVFFIRDFVAQYIICSVYLRVIANTIQIPHFFGLFLRLNLLSPTPPTENCNWKMEYCDGFPAYARGWLAIDESSSSS